ncbi:hypothetical protein T01_10333 [Trichinella spiralis]|uniref:Uncharacterized protein n=1 Tax=Trichinella spiralis TaxID=6334 RepID=A0A0V0YUZ8_TRISP|nr:hypothetical protein T01_10333 [Trichinella spiralis]
MNSQRQQQKTVNGTNKMKTTKKQESGIKWLRRYIH